MLTESDVRELVNVLRRFPRVETVGIGQLCEADCVATFRIDIARGAWRSLQVISFAACAVK